MDPGRDLEDERLVDFLENELQGEVNVADTIESAFPDHPYIWESLLHAVEHMLQRIDECGLESMSVWNGEESAFLKAVRDAVEREQWRNSREGR